ncbi:hypothetical protein CYY_008144 [Polysphondylium violaceum]|uniref:PH domain-containing protein n=1 Tax=Polysphondylium violaceum TaxID=133409 RepID=A0A8J4PNK6_9MYCE|nr:hypothetical protein CYY_008144 [Polysphondylium violaceum]
MAEIFITKTIETNQRFQKQGKTKEEYQDSITQVIRTCLEDHSIEKVNSLKKLLPTIDQVVVSESPVCGYLMYILADSCRKSNLYKDSIDFANKSLKIREVLYGDDSNEVCICLDLLSQSLIENNQFEEASRVFIRSFQGKAVGGYTMFQQLSTDTFKFISQIQEQNQPNYSLNKQVAPPKSPNILPMPPSVSSISSGAQSQSSTISASTSSSSISSLASGASSNINSNSILHQQQTTTQIPPSSLNQIIITTLYRLVEILQKLLVESNRQGLNEKSLALKKVIVQLIMEEARYYTEESKHQEATDTYISILTLLNHSGQKEERVAFELAILSLVKIDKYEEIKANIELFIGMAIKCFKVPSIELASVLWFCGRILEDQSDKSSPTKLCDLVDALRYYLCTFKISREIGGVNIGEESTAVAQKKIREKIETILFNNRPLRPEDVVKLVDAMIRMTTTDFLLNGLKSQNWLLKYVYPDFMAEDALREKFETLPSKSGYLSKMGGLMKDWKTRWFSLERDVLSYYKYNNDPKPQSELQILEIKSIEIISTKEKKFKPYVHCFQLVHPKHNLILAADNEDIMKEWVSVLNRAKQYWEDWSNITLSLN